MNEFTIKIAGEAGQGMQTIGTALCRIFKKAGYNIFANQDYMSRVRGGNNFFQLRVADSQIFSLRKKSDIVIALDKQSVAIHKANLNEGGIIVLDKKKFDIPEDDKTFFDVPLYELAVSVGGSDIFISTVSCGVIAGINRLEFAYLEEAIKDIFAGKGDESIKKNVSAARAGYDFAKNKPGKEKNKPKASSAKNTLLIDGNEAIALGAIRAGCKFYSAYPMTPSTSIMNTIAHYAGRFNIVVEQAEDEIAAINMALGASYGGSRSMTATSGGGFALMVEGLSLAGMTETPVVIVDAQRPAPATGFPTRTEQSDLDFLIHAGHGEFARVVYTPGTIEDAFYLTIKAFNIAEEYQIPVLIMTDQHLADSIRDIEAFDLNKVKIQRHIISRSESKKITGYKRYQFTESGVSPRAIPSWIEDVIYVDSDEHNEEGHITEEADIRIKMVEKRFYKKMNALAREIEQPAAYNLVKAKTILLGFGSTYGAIKEVCETSNENIGFVHLSQVWPFPTQEITRLLNGKKNIITVENNAAGQLARLLMRETGIKVSGSVLRFDGRPFDLDYLNAQLSKRDI